MYTALCFGKCTYSFGKFWQMYIFIHSLYFLVLCSIYGCCKNLLILLFKFSTFLLSFIHHHNQGIEYPSPTKISLCTFVVFHILNSNPWKPMVCIFPYYCINISPVVFWLCLLSLNVIQLKFICGFTWISSSLWSDNWSIWFWFFDTFWGLFWSLICCHFLSKWPHMYLKGILSIFCCCVIYI